MIYEINGKQAELKKVLPLKLGDYEDLEIKGVVQKDMSNMTFKQVRIMIEHILQKANPAITPDDVRSLTMEQTVDLQKKINAVMTEKPDIPT